MGSSPASVPNPGMVAHIWNDAWAMLQKWKVSGTPKLGGIAERWRQHRVSLKKKTTTQEYTQGKDTGEFRARHGGCQGRK